MNIESIDLNLLRLFDAIWRRRNVSQAAEELGLSQPAASQGLGRLRRQLGDALFHRAPGGVQPTPRADQLAAAIQSALSLLESALQAPADAFVPQQSRRVFRLHLSDIGEARFLPALMALLRHEAPFTRIETAPLPQAEIAPALHAGRIDLAIGYLREVTDTSTRALLTDVYVVMLRHDHPVARRWRRSRTAPGHDALGELEFATVRSHADTLRILNLLGLQDRVRLTAANFLSLPMTVQTTDLAVLMPRSIAVGIAPQRQFALFDPVLPMRELSVAMHWSRRFEHDPAQRWLRSRVAALFPGG
ncbi:LysR family transcriptional regulator [Ottowia sp. SB7-C50]|uniref:LysR family transcriptional regulator n=1 Tax=Ottowia sp. SB7-C50 TaxID=3081231 RepID=UPI00295405A0|nr:LysR family transcriptional regulator [Ottowia sp. SB7-C50]WOP16707.1 LysR family transcriptional regulator [Ottowia sp. SB7-C50]